MIHFMYVKKLQFLVPLSILFRLNRKNHMSEILKSRTQKKQVQNGLFKSLRQIFKSTGIAKFTERSAVAKW